MSWQRLWGPEDFGNVCGDDSLYEVGSVYGEGQPINPNGDRALEAEVIYYVEGDDTNGYGVRVQTQTYRRRVNGDAFDEQYDYDWGSALSFPTLAAAIEVADTLAAVDESDTFVWAPESPSVAG